MRAVNTRIWTVEIHHRHGCDVISGDAAVRSATDALYEYVTDYWHEIAGELPDGATAPLPDEVPIDVDDAIRLYFETHPCESFDMHEQALAR